jgi:hypothetical protein
LVRCASILSILILFGVVIVSLANFFPLTFHSSATVVVGLTPLQQSDLMATFCTTAGRDAAAAAGRLTLDGIVADATLNYGVRHRDEVDLKTARRMLHAALAAQPQETPIARLCADLGHRFESNNPELQRPLSAATAAAGPGR